MLLYKVLLRLDQEYSMLKQQLFQFQMLPEYKLHWLHFLMEKIIQHHLSSYYL